MAGGRWLGLGLLCAVLALLALAGAAAAAPKHHPKKPTETFVNEPEPPHAAITLGGSNGYEIRLSIHSGGADAFVDKRPESETESSVAYDLLHGTATAHRVRANFGRVGMVSARFVPSGRVERTKDPACKGGPEVTRYGSFVGTIRFEGEEGFTTFSSHRVKGSISSAPRQFCRVPKTRFVESSPDPKPKHFLTEFFASAITATTATYFQVTERELEPQVARFQASRFENRGDMLITRELTVEGPAAGFAFDAGLDHATLAPPAPFAGTAAFTRIDDFASRWEGPLTVSLPGVANLPLTGRAYSWGLERTTDPDDDVG